MLSEEEKKAIKIVKKIKDMKFKVTSSFYSSGTISLSIEEKEAIDTVLNLITKLQKENEELKITVNKQSIDISNNLLELQQKDKQIDELVKYIDSNNYVDNEECQFQWDFKIEKCIGNGDCKECIKQYFETKAKKEQ